MRYVVVMFIIHFVFIRVLNFNLNFCDMHIINIHGLLNLVCGKFSRWSNFGGRRGTHYYFRTIVYASLTVYVNGYTMLLFIQVLCGHLIGKFIGDSVKEAVST